MVDVQIPQQDRKPVIKYNDKEYEVAILKLKDIRSLNIDSENMSTEQIFGIIEARLPGMTKEEMEDIPMSHLEPIVLAIDKAEKESFTEKKTG